MKTFKQFIEEDGPTNTAGGGAIAGIGVGPQGEPGFRKKARSKKSGVTATNIYTDNYYSDNYHHNNNASA